MIDKNSFDGKIILVTGATGLIGSNLVQRLLNLGVSKIYVLGRSLIRLQSCFADCNRKESLVFLEQDISMPLKMPESIDYIFHAAGNISGSAIKDSPVDIIKPNILGAMNCLELLKAQKAHGKIGRLIAFSSATVYGEDRGACLKEEDTKSANQIESTVSAYSEGKRMTEVMCNAYYNQFGVDSVRCRLGYVYGPSYYKTKTALNSFLDVAANAKIKGGGQLYSNYS